MEQPKYRLVYFNVRALAEPIRWIFAYSGTEYVDERIPWDYPAWFSTQKQKFSSTVGQIPVLHIDGKELSQSQVISRLLANRFGLVGGNEWENARVDEVIGMVYDLFILWRGVTFENDPQRKAFMRQNYVDPKFKLYYAKWSSIIQESGGPFILGDKLTHADFWLASFISIYDEPLKGLRPIMIERFAEPQKSDIYVGMTKDFPLLKKHQETVESLPKIKEWIAKRPETIA